MQFMLWICAKVYCKIKLKIFSWSEISGYAHVNHFVLISPLLQLNSTDDKIVFCIFLLSLWERVCTIFRILKWQRSFKGGCRKTKSIYLLMTCHEFSSVVPALAPTACVYRMCVNKAVRCVYRHVLSKMLSWLHTTNVHKTLNLRHK